MSGPVLDFDPGAVRRLPTGQPVDTRDAPGVFSLVPEQWRVAEDELATVQQSRLRDKYRPVVDALIERGYDRSAIFDSLQVDPAREVEGAGEYNRAAIWQFIKRERETARRAGGADPFPTLPQDRKTFEQPELSRFGERYEDQAEIARGSFGAQLGSALIGGGALEMTRPLNLATLPIGGFGKGIATKILTEGLTQMGITAIGLPEQIAGRAAMGEEYTVGEALINIAGAGVAGAALRGGFELAPGAARAVGENIVDPLRRLADPDFEAKQLARAFDQIVPRHLRTPEQDAALFVLQRQAEVEGVNPYINTHEGIDAHVAKMEATLRALEDGRIARPEELTNASSPIPAASPVSRPITGGGYDLASVKAAIRGPESRGNDFATNGMGSSAAGRYQFIEETFKGLYKRVYRVNDAAAEAAWNSNRKFDVGVQEALMDRLVADNAAALERAGIAADPGNLYLAHFAGAGKAIELLRAPKDAPVSAFFSAKAIRQNPTYLGGGRTVGEAIDTIRGKVGDEAQASPAPIDPRLLEPELRNPAIDAERSAAPLIDEKAADAGLPEPVQLLIDPLRELVTGTRLSLNRTGDLARELGTDEATLREALTALVERGDITQNRATGKFMRKAAAPVTAANQKRPRTLIEFLAERGGLNDWGGDLQSRGIKSGTRKVGAKIIRNARRSDKTVIPGEGEWGLDRAFQAAREEGYFPEFDGRTEDTYGDAIDGVQALLAAIDEELSGSPRYRMDDWDRLPEFKLTGSTEAIYGGRIKAEDGIDEPNAVDQLIDSFREAWDGFGYDAAELAPFDRDFLRRAAEFYDRGDAFLPEHALAMAATEDYETALAAAIREGLADEYSSYDPWNPEWDAEFDARFEAARARNRADGNLLAGSARDDGNAGAGSARSEQPQGGQPADGQGQSPARLDAAAAAKPRSDHTDLPPDIDPRFDEPDGAGIAATAESAWHDIRVAGEADPNIAARQRQEAQMGGDAPMRATAEQDGTMGLGLFDSVDQKTLFDLGDGRGERSIADIRAELDADKAAIDTIRSCMT